MKIMNGHTPLAVAAMLLITGMMSGCAQNPTTTTVAPVAAETPQLSAEDRAGFLVHAARSGAIDELRKYLAAGTDINAFDTLDQTALIAAIDHHHLDIVRLLLDRGADVRLADHAGWTPLIHAAYFGANDELLALLLDRGADINAQNDRGVTALYMSAAYGREQTTQLLLKRGANAALPTQSGYTALRIAQLRGFERVVALLDGKPLPAPLSTGPATADGKPAKADGAGAR